MSNVTLKMDITKYNLVKKGYKSFMVPAKGDYIDFIAKKDGVVITGYLSKHQNKKINFVGDNADKEAKRWDDTKKAPVQKATTKKAATKKKDKLLLSKDEYLKKEKAASKKATTKKTATKKAETKKASAKKVEAKKVATKKVEAKKEGKKVEAMKEIVKKAPTKKTEKKKVLLSKKEFLAKEIANKKETSKTKDNKAKKEVTKVNKIVPAETKKVEAKPLNKEVPDEKKTWVDYNDQIGSDEVGVGDFLGPIIVVATYVKKSDIKMLKDLGVKDSKKLTDQKIREIAPILIKNLEFSKLTLSNERYNQLITAHENLNSIKAKLHNRALYNLVNKHPDTIGVYIDQFVSKEKFYEYLDDPEEPVVKDIAFSTKGESLFPSVAAASIIARYSYLLEMDNLNKLYKTVIPFGASKFVTEFARDFIAKYGVMELNKIAKRNFANYMEAISVKLV